MVELPAEQVAGSCSYCASQLVDVQRGDASIDGVAPFRVPKAAALDKLRQHLAGRVWAPSELRKLAAGGRVRAELKGLLVPFYAYDARCRSSYRAKIGVHWYRRQTRTGKDGKTRAEQVQETEWFSLTGSAVGQLADHLESASSGLSASDLVGLAGFDLGRTLPFDPHLLAGFEAELPSRPRADVDRDADESIRAKEARRITHRLLPGDAHRKVEIQCDVTVARVQLVLLPVWITAYRHGGEVFRMLVHGQDGRCHGAVPVSRTKVVGAALAVAALGVLVLWLWGVWR